MAARIEGNGLPPTSYGLAYEVLMVGYLASNQAVAGSIPVMRSDPFDAARVAVYDGSCWVPEPNDLRRSSKPRLLPLAAGRAGLKGSLRRHHARMV